MEKDDVYNYFNSHNEVYEKLEHLVKLEGYLDDHSYTINSYEYKNGEIMVFVEYYEYQQSEWVALAFKLSYFYDADLLEKFESTANDTKDKREEEKLQKQLNKQREKDLAELERLQKKYT